MQQPPPISLDDEASQQGKREALVLARQLAPLLARPDAGVACWTALAEAAVNAGLACAIREVVGHRLLVAAAQGGSNPTAPTAHGPDAPVHVGLCAALQAAPVATGPSAANAADALVPSGAWSACLALGTTIAAAAHGIAGVESLLELAVDPATQGALDPDGDDWLDAWFRAQSLLIGGDGGLPFTDGQHLMLPVTAAVRGALWAELTVDLDALPADLDPSLRARADRLGAASVLAEACARLPRWSPRPGPLLHALRDGFASVADPTDTSWLDDLVDLERQHLFLAMLQAPERVFLSATQVPSITVTRLDAGERPDTLPRRARAVLDVRAPADRDVGDVWPDLQRLASPLVQVGLLAERQPRLLLPPHSIYVALRRALASGGDAVGVFPVQARREQRGIFWQQHDAPVLGLAPAWPGLEVDAEPAVSAGMLAVPAEGLAWGAALFARLVLVDLRNLQIV